MVKNPLANAGDLRDTGSDPWVRKILQRRARQPILVFLPGKFHGQRSLLGYSPWGCKELDMTEGLSTVQHSKYFFGIRKKFIKILGYCFYPQILPPAITGCYLIHQENCLGTERPWVKTSVLLGQSLQTTHLESQHPYYSDIVTIVNEIIKYKCKKKVCPQDSFHYKKDMYKVAADSRIE